MSKEPLVKGAPSGITDGSQRGFAVDNRRCVSRVRPTRPQVVGGGGTRRVRSDAVGQTARQGGGGGVSVVVVGAGPDATTPPSLVTEAINLVGDGRFVRATYRTATYALCRQVGFGEDTLSVRRARSTWLVAHLHAVTSLAALRRIAGPVSGDTLNALLAASDAELDTIEAAVGGLGA